MMSSLSWDAPARIADASDGAFGVQRPDLRRLQLQERLENLIRVLPERGRRRLHLAWRRVQLDRHAHHGDAAGLGMPKRLDHAAGLQMLALAHLRDRADAPGRNARRFEALHPFVRAALA